MTAYSSVRSSIRSSTAVTLGRRSPQTEVPIPEQIPVEKTSVEETLLETTRVDNPKEERIVGIEIQDTHYLEAMPSWVKALVILAGSSATLLAILLNLPEKSQSESKIDLKSHGEPIEIKAFQPLRHSFSKGETTTPLKEPKKTQGFSRTAKAPSSVESAGGLQEGTRSDGVISSEASESLSQSLDNILAPPAPVPTRSGLASPVALPLETLTPETAAQMPWVLDLP